MKAISWGMIGIAVYSFVVIVFFGLNFVSDSSIRQIHDVTDRSYVHLCTFQLLNLFLTCCLLQIFEGKPTYKSISCSITGKKGCCADCCHRQESGTTSTDISIGQDEKNGNSWIGLGVAEGSLDEKDVETPTVTDSKLPVDRRSLLQ